MPGLISAFCLSLTIAAWGTRTQPVVAVHVSETTKAHWPQLPGPHSEWKYWHIHGFLREVLRSDGTPVAVVTDADIAAGRLLVESNDGASPRYPILISLAATCLPEAAVEPLDRYIRAGGHAYVGSTSWTRDESGRERRERRERREGREGREGREQDDTGAPAFALPDALGLAPVQTALIGTARKVADHPLTRDLAPTDELNWLLPRSASSIGYAHPEHWIQVVRANTARVLLVSGAASGAVPLLTVRDYGAGQVIYHAEFAPLAGFSGYVVDHLTYAFLRRAIELAFEKQGVPLVRLSPWPYPFRAALKTRHDHFPHALAARLEAKRGVRGEWLLRTGEALEPGYRAELDGVIEAGGLIGSHTTNEYTLDSGDYKAAFSNIEASLGALQTVLGHRPKLFVAPGMMAFRETSVAAIVANGLVTSGDYGHGPFPNFALKLDAAEDYGPTAHSELLELPVSRYPAPPNATWSNLIYAHMDAMPLEVIERTVDLTYALGGLINLYDHVGDPSPHLHTVWPYPTTRHLEHYIDYSLAKPAVWKTDPLLLLNWWRIRNAHALAPTLDRDTAGDLIMTVRLTRSEWAGTAPNAALPPPPPPVPIPRRPVPLAVALQVPANLRVLSLRRGRAEVLGVPVNRSDLLLPLGPDDRITVRFRAPASPAHSNH